MTYFPHNPSRPGHVPGATTPGRTGAPRDVLWGRPVFRAPQLKLRVKPEPIPFTAQRVTRPSQAR
jgi:hypothetical protein